MGVRIGRLNEDGSDVELHLEQDGEDVNVVTDGGEIILYFHTLSGKVYYDLLDYCSDERLALSADGRLKRRAPRDT